MDKSSDPYMGLDATDIPACYRHRAQRMADGAIRRAACALVIEFDSEGRPAVQLFSCTPDMTEREQTALMLNAIQALACGAEYSNAQAAH